MTTKTPMFTSPPESPAVVLNNWFKTLGPDMRGLLAVGSRALTQGVTSPGLVQDAPAALEETMTTLAASNRLSTSGAAVVAFSASFSLLLGQHQSREEWELLWPIRQQVALLSLSATASPDEGAAVLASARQAFEDEFSEICRARDELAGLMATELSPPYVRSWYRLHGGSRWAHRPQK